MHLERTVPARDCDCPLPSLAIRPPQTVLPMALLVATLLGSSGAAVASELSGSWPQWRGPAGDGHAPDARGLPRRWSERENIVWKVDLPGKGWSSPVVADGRIWVTTAVESEATEEDRRRRLEGRANADTLELSGPLSLRTICVAHDTGQVLYDVELFRVDSPPAIHKLNSYASPSPILAGGRLYCHFGDFGTACLDASNGEVLWSNRLLRLDHENGPGSTPVLWHDRLIVHCDGIDVQYVAALDTASGAIAWKTPRSGTLRDDPQLKKSYGTPLVVSHDGRELLVSPAADWLYAYDPATGRELWKLSYGVLGFSVVPRPVAASDMLVMSTSFTQPQLLGIRLGKGDATPTIAWRESRGAPSQPSPLIVGRELYVVSDNGVASCLDVETGSNHWTRRLGGSFSSSPLYADGVIYASNRDGQTFVLSPGTELELEADNELDGSIMASPVALGRSLFIRTDRSLYRITEGGTEHAAAGRR